MHRRVLSTRSLNSYWLATIAIIYNTNISYAYNTMRACLSLLYLGLFQPVERLSVSDVDMDGSWARV